MVLFALAALKSHALGGLLRKEIVKDAVLVAETGIVVFAASEMASSLLRKK
jgi:hypothetical protein